MAKFNLHLQHGNMPTHNEYWAVAEGEVKVSGQRPGSYPPQFNTSMLPLQALVQLMVMLTVEGWKIMSADKKWQQWIQSLAVPQHGAELSEEDEMHTSNLERAQMN